MSLWWTHPHSNGCVCVLKSFQKFVWTNKIKTNVPVLWLCGQSLNRSRTIAVSVMFSVVVYSIIHVTIIVIWLSYKLGHVEGGSNFSKPPYHKTMGSNPSVNRRHTTNTIKALFKSMPMYVVLCWTLRSSNSNLNEYLHRSYHARHLTLWQNDIQFAIYYIWDYNPPSSSSCDPMNKDVCNVPILR